MFCVVKQKGQSNETTTAVSKIHQLATTAKIMTHHLASTAKNILQ